MHRIVKYKGETNLMKVLIPFDENFNYSECRKMYEYYQPVINDDASFDEVINNTFFYSFYDKDKLSLCVYFFMEADKLWVNGYGIRKNHLFNKKAFSQALNWFNCDIWAISDKKPAIFGLLSCGFKKYEKNIYVYRQNN